MKVKYAREVLSEETASIMERSDFPFTLNETEQTRSYIRMCDKLFKTINTSTLDGAYMKDLMAVLRWFQTWFHEINRESQQRQGNKSSSTVRQQFIPRKTYQDLLVMIRGIIGTIGYININYSYINGVPKSMCQDDVENYFSLVRVRETSPTVQRFFEIRKTLVADFNITNELGMMECSSSSSDAPALQMKPGEVQLTRESTTYKHNKAVRKEQYLIKIRASLLKASAKSAHQTHVTSLPMYYSIEPNHMNQLINQCHAIVQIIDHALPEAILNRTIQTIEALKDANNKEIFTKFKILLDRNIRSNYFKLTGFCYKTYIRAEKEVFEDDAVYSWWTALTSLICGGNEGTEEAMFMYIKKFLKRPCVTYLGKDGLSPSFNNSKATRQRITDKRGISKKDSQPKAQPNDVCLRCGMLGHWAEDCTYPPQPEWLANQTCFKCGCLGHLAENCKSKKMVRSKVSQQATRRPNLPNIVSSLPTVNLKEQQSCKMLQEAPPQVSDKRNYLKQRTEKCFQERRKYINASKMGTVLGFHGKKEFALYWSTLHGMSSDSVEAPSSIASLSMEWGTICEDNARVTYLDYIGQTNPYATVHETGLWVISWKGTEVIGCSPDDLVEMHSTGIKPTSGRGITEYKCPFKGGFPWHYKTIPPSYYLQMQLNMWATTSLFVWTPKTTRIYLVQRDDQFLDSLLNVTFHRYWNLKTKPDNPHPTLLDLKMQAEKKSREIITVTEIPSLCSTSCLDHLSQFSPRTVDSLVKEKKPGYRKVRHCSKCHRLLKVCNKDKCEEKRKGACRSLSFNARISSVVTANATPSKDGFSSFRNGPGAIPNSCHQDALLVILNEFL